MTPLTTPQAAIEAAAKIVERMLDWEGDRASILVADIAAAIRALPVAEDPERSALEEVAAVAERMRDVQAALNAGDTVFSEVADEAFVAVDAALSRLKAARVAAGGEE